jgi:isoquinoline 1-oxidoreductase alpha subunit
MAHLKLHVNGMVHELDVPPVKPLLWVLRDDLGLKGTEYGCGVAECDKCLVRLDGRPVRSCSILVADVGDAEITTVEGLDGDSILLRAESEA